MYIDVIISTLLGLGTIILSLLSQAELWQRKEYRFDRILAYLNDSSRTLATRHLLIIGILTIGLGWMFFLTDHMQTATYIGWVSLLCFLFDHANRIRDRGVFRPKITPKVSLLLLTGFVLSALYFVITFTHLLVPALQWATLIFFLPFIMALSVVLVNIPANLRKKQIIRKAKNLRGKLKNLKVVGITGSVGKTSTKHFLKHILEGTHLNVAATKEHRNSELVVAIDMVEQLTPQTDIYIAEMGAYCMGEIKALVELAKPQVGILTLIGNQHLSLFGTRKNILKSKWELIKGLSNKGTAVLNADDSLLVEKSKETKKEMVWYSLDGKGDVRATDIKESPTSISFTLHIKRKKKEIEAHIASRGLLSSLLAAISAAHALGIDTEHIFKQASTVTSYEQTMKIVTGKKKATVIDDSYSASEQSVVNALDHLNTFDTADKRIVFVPILELGTEASKVHEMVGRKLAESKAKVYIYGENYKEALQRGMADNNKDARIQWIVDPMQLKDLITKYITSNTVILLEGRCPSIIRKSLLS